ncbi:transposase-like protein [Colletotrichum graminicola]|nr:transposase-like protein [Colletotrichum graminicola]
MVSYYEKLGDSPLFAASIILHPGLGISYLEAIWDEGEQLSWLRDAKKGIRDHFDRWYRPADNSGDGFEVSEISLLPHEDSHFSNGLIAEEGGRVLKKVLRLMTSWQCISGGLLSVLPTL